MARGPEQPLLTEKATFAALENQTLGTRRDETDAYLDPPHTAKTISDRTLYLVKPG